MGESEGRRRPAEGVPEYLAAVIMPERKEVSVAGVRSALPGALNRQR